MSKEAKKPRSFYFGTYRGLGHYLWDESMRHVPVSYEPKDGLWWKPLPWEKIDGVLNPKTKREGHSYCFHRDGWTAIAFANRTDDSRGNSNSGFYFEEVLTFDQAVARAKEVFPHVVEHWSFEIVEIDFRCQTCGHGQWVHVYGRCRTDGCECQQWSQALPSNPESDSQ